MEGMSSSICLRASHSDSSQLDDLLKSVGHIDHVIGHAVEANRKFKEGLAGSLEDKQNAVAEAMKRVGPPMWKVRTDLCYVLPCDSCEDHCVHGESAFHDIVNHQTGKPLFDPKNMAGFQKVVSGIPVPNGHEALNMHTPQANADSKMAFQLKGKQKEAMRLFVAGSVGGGVGFALVDHFAIQRISGFDHNMKDAIHLAIGVVGTLAGLGFNKLWLGEWGAAYSAVPIARLAERNLLGGIPVGAVRVFSPLQVNGRTAASIGVPPTFVSGAKTF